MHLSFNIPNRINNSTIIIHYSQYRPLQTKNRKKKKEKEKSRDQIKQKLAKKKDNRRKKRDV